MVWLNMAVATLIATLAGLGIGGGGLLVIYMTLVLGTPQLAAQGINLVFFVFSAAASLLVHYKKRNINVKLVTTLAIGGICGSVFGVYLSHTLEPSLIRKCFGVLLIISGMLTLFSKTPAKEKE